MAVAAAAGDSDDELIGVTIAGRYRIISRLGAGGMGVAYRAWDERDGVPVVIKIPKKAFFEDPRFAERFFREMRLLQGLGHPHIAPLTDVGEHDGLPFVVLRFLPGGSLSDRRLRDESRRPKPNPAGMLHLWLPAVAEALDFIHSQGVVHRDVKPANIFFDAFWGAYLGDFGIAKIIEESDTFDKEHTLTATHMGIGTQEYMSAEQFTPKAVIDGRADQYALAVTVYEMLAGVRPFTGATNNLIVEVLTHPVPPLQSHRQDLPASLCDAVHRGLAKVSAERFPTCREFAAAVLRDVPPMEDEPGVARLLCPKCANILKLPTEAAGRKGKCPRCQTAMKVAEDLGSLWLLNEAKRQRKATTYAEEATELGPQPVSVDVDEQALEDFKPVSDARPIPKRPSPRRRTIPNEVLIGLGVAVMGAVLFWGVNLLGGGREKPKPPATYEQQLEAAITTLKSNPSSPSGNEVVGKHLCFREQNWRKGLPFLVKSRAYGLSTLAQREIDALNAKSGSAGKLIAVAREWWDFTNREESSTGEWGPAIKKHATDLYLQYVGSLETAADAEFANKWLDSDTAFQDRVANKRPTVVSVPTAIDDKTLVAWVRLHNLEQRGGSAITLEDNRNAFDAVVFGEFVPGRWYVGSNNGRRSSPSPDALPPENDAVRRAVCMAIVYEGNTVTMYRDGKVYEKHTITRPYSFDYRNSNVLFGLRHTTAGDRACLAADIDDARIYGVALSAAEIASLRPNDLTAGRRPLASWTFSDGKLGEESGCFPQATLVNAEIRDGRLVLNGSNSYAIFRPSLEVGQSWPNADVLGKLVSEARGGDLRLGGLRQVTPEIARVLSEATGQTLALNGLATLTPQGAHAIAGVKCDRLILDGLQMLSVETARALSAFSGYQLSLDGVSVLSPQVVPLLSTFKGCLSLGGLKDLPAELAKGLATFQADHLHLDGLTTLSMDSAKALAGFPGEELFLDGLDELSSETAQALAAFSGSRLTLNGVRTLSPQIAQECAKFKSSNLSLDGLSTLSVETARGLAGFRGFQMSLGGVRNLSPQVSGELARFRGWLGLGGLTDLSPDAAQRLSAGDCQFIVLDGLQGLSASQAEALSRFKGGLHLNGLTTLTPEVAQLCSGFDCRLLSLGGLASIAPDVLQRLLQIKGALGLTGLTTLSLAEATTVATFKGEKLLLFGLKDLPEPVRQTLASNPRVILSPKSPNQNRAEPGGTQARIPAVAGGSGVAAVPPIEHALKWLMAHQADDGSWSFDLKQCSGCSGQCSGSGAYPDRAGATAMALLACLSRGYTHRDGPFRRQIEAGLNYLESRAKSRNGVLYEAGNRSLLVQGMASLALSECYAMTKDERFRQPAQLSLNHIMETQDGASGGWPFSAGQRCDTVATVVQLTALKSGQLAGLQVSPMAAKKSAKFFDSVEADDGSAYGALSPHDVTDRSSAAGLLGRIYLGWKSDNPKLRRGEERLAQTGPTGDLVFDFLASQVLHHVSLSQQGGEPYKLWTTRTREMLQRTMASQGHESGSWSENVNDDVLLDGGRLYCTALVAMTNGVYYRHLPIHRGGSFSESFLAEVEETAARTVLPDPRTLTGFKESVGQTLSFKVVGTATGGVWGSNPYTADSLLGKAVVHAGFLKPGEAGIVSVTVLPGQQGYAGSTKNGITTGRWGAYGLSYRVEGAATSTKTKSATSTREKTALPLRTRPLARFAFDGTAKNTGIASATCDLRNTDFKDGALVLNGEYELAGKTGYRAVCSVPGQDLATFTVAVRLKLELLSDRNVVIVGGTGWRWLQLVCSRDGKLRLTLNNQRESHEITGVQIANDEWCVVGCSFNKLQRKVLVSVNGDSPVEIELEKDFVLNADEQSSKEWAFTNYSNGATCKGLVDELVVYGDALTASELLRIPLMLKQGGDNKGEDAGETASPLDAISIPK